jgi:hypothetical protein
MEPLPGNRVPVMFEVVDLEVAKLVVISVIPFNEKSKVPEIKKAFDDLISCVNKYIQEDNTILVENIEYLKDQISELNKKFKFLKNRKMEKIKLSKFWDGEVLPGHVVSPNGEVATLRKWQEELKNQSEYEPQLVDMSFEDVIKAIDNASVRSGNITAGSIPNLKDKIRELGKLFGNFVEE